MSNEITIYENQITAQEQAEFLDSLSLLFEGLSDNSRRQYQRTFDAWEAYCSLQEIPAWFMKPSLVLDFIKTSGWSNNTRQARLSHMRKFIAVMYTSNPQNPEFQRWYTQSKEIMKGKHLGGEKFVRPKKALRVKEIVRVFDTWDVNKNAGLRNRALLAVLFYAGLRRFEAAQLKWTQIDFDAGLIKVEGGKGDKDASVPIMSDEGIDILQEWYRRQSQFGDFEFVFPPINKGDNIERDNPIKKWSVNDIINKTCAISGVDFRSHDARRTLITDLLDNGANVHEVQRIARHERGQTTLLYAQSKDAKDLREKLKNKLSY